VRGLNSLNDPDDKLERACLLACLFPGPKEKVEAEINPQRADSWITLMQIASLEETWKALKLPST
jgi:hypothetical protein